jgi:RNA polymerase sigma factor, sigma-70 family
MQECDVKAMQLCQQGDISGLELLVTQYQLAALRLAYLVIGERSLAEDIVQDSFLHVYRSSPQFRLDKPFLPWFYQIVLNTAREYRRKAFQQRTISWDDLSEDSNAHVAITQGTILRQSSTTDPYQYIEHVERYEAIFKALMQLTPIQREAIILRYYYGFNEREMTAILRCLPGTVKWRLHAGLRALERVIRRQYVWLLEHGSSDSVTEERVLGCFTSKGQ